MEGIALFVRLILSSGCLPIFMTEASVFWLLLMLKARELLSPATRGKDNMAAGPNVDMALKHREQQEELSGQMAKACKLLHEAKFLTILQ